MPRSLYLVLHAVCYTLYNRPDGGVFINYAALMRSLWALDYTSARVRVAAKYAPHGKRRSHAIHIAFVNYILRFYYTKCVPICMLFKLICSVRPSFEAQQHVDFSSITIEYQLRGRIQQSAHHPTLSIQYYVCHRLKIGCDTNCGLSTGPIGAEMCCLFILFPIPSINARARARTLCETDLQYRP